VVLVDNNFGSIGTLSYERVVCLELRKYPLIPGLKKE